MDTIQLVGAVTLILRKASLYERAVPREKLFHALEVQVPLDENEQLLSFGPIFGEEALHVFTQRLERLGLRYEDDFFGFDPVVPHWCGLLAYWREEKDEI